MDIGADDLALRHDGRRVGLRGAEQPEHAENQQDDGKHCKKKGARPAPGGEDADEQRGDHEPEDDNRDDEGEKPGAGVEPEQRDRGGAGAAVAPQLYNLVLQRELLALADVTVMPGPIGALDLHQALLSPRQGLEVDAVRRRHADGHAPPGQEEIDKPQSTARDQEDREERDFPGPRAGPAPYIIVALIGVVAAAVVVLTRAFTIRIAAI